MKTDIYTLLGMIKDNKAPKKIWYKGFIFEYIEDEKDYSNKEINEWLFDDCIITYILNDFVEILETTITYKQEVDTLFDNICKTPGLNLIDNTNKIEKIKDLDFNTRTPQPANENEAFLMTCINWLVYKQDEIIDKVNKL